MLQHLQTNSFCSVRFYPLYHSFLQLVANGVELILSLLTKRNVSHSLFTVSERYSQNVATGDLTPRVN